MHLILPDEMVSANNRQLLIPVPVLCLPVLVYFRKPEPEDTCVKWMPAAAILSKIAIYGKIQVNRQAIQTLVLSLEKYRFRTRRNAQGSTEYEVVDLQNDEVNKGFGK